jgi:L-amino acid N-acyltransferase YncA
VTDTSITFDEIPPTADQFAERIATISARHAFLVSESGPEVTGFAYAAPYRERPAYRWTVEVSVYLDPDHRGRGIGKALYGALLPLLTRHGLWVALAAITLPNPASVALHEGFGFVPVGTYRGIGWKAGAWRDVGWWQRSLQDRPGPPAELGSPARL